MKKILLISDTHNNQKLLRKVISSIKGITHIFHLGDNYEDLESNYDLIENIILYRVPGIFNQKYLSGSLPACISVEIENWSFVLVHSIDDIKISRLKGDFYLFGHTHEPVFFIRNNVYYLNPGHLRKDFDRGHEASYCIMEVENNKIKIDINTISGNLFFVKTLIK